MKLEFSLVSTLFGNVYVLKLYHVAAITRRIGLLALNGIHVHLATNKKKKTVIYPNTDIDLLNI